MAVHHHPGTFANSTDLVVEERNGNDHPGFKISACSYPTLHRKEAGRAAGHIWWKFDSLNGNRDSDAYVIFRKVAEISCTPASSQRSGVMNSAMNF
ncbi:hypothetical protein N7468_000886 [Penicillium chermesinum]|uniref:Uncharacterized protein n=1 Tax=Penicillium chermesinum TaxID=63820 RepID=A0A9W9TWU4_9EURO|nr:uncharacterized protein N7468_000886 [Penicillium chermesinum]KAJ5245903.1 hypothetical protein N7468_000886 [Penicillium chermesinum]